MKRFTIVGLCLVTMFATCALIEATSAVAFLNMDQGYACVTPVKEKGHLQR